MENIETGVHKYKNNWILSVVIISKTYQPSDSRRSIPAYMISISQMKCNGRSIWLVFASPIVPDSQIHQEHWTLFSFPEVSTVPAVQRKVAVLNCEMLSFPMGICCYTSHQGKKQLNAPQNTSEMHYKSKTCLLTTPGNHFWYGITSL